MDFSTHLPRATSVITRAAQSKSNRDLKQSGFATIKTRALQGSYRGFRAGIEILLCFCVRSDPFTKRSGDMVYTSVVD